MGNDFALAVLSDRGPLLYSYFKQLFAQVTNPPIDPIREKIVMSVSTSVGPEGNLLDETPEHAHQLIISQPLLTTGELEKLRQVDHHVFRADTLDATWPVSEGPAGIQRALDRLCREASAAIDAGDNILILSDRQAGAERAPLPALLAVGAVHHHLVREGTRLQAGLVVESGEPREVHHIACLLGYGASAVCPYLAFETLFDMFDRGVLPGVNGADEAERNMIKAVGKGLLKTISKMGISTVRSYSGAQIFEAVGLEPALVERYFTGTTSRIGGIGLDVLARETLTRHARAYPQGARPASEERLPGGGVHAWRRDGEHHQWNPDTIANVQDAVRHGGREAYERFTAEVNDQSRRRATLRGLLKLRTQDEPIPLDEVEPAAEIVKRFATGAMSLGSISTEAHETLAIAMNRLGGKSNTGEGGEDPRRFTRDDNGDSRRSAIKQVASGRFGVTAHYLVNADELQIKMAQGAKPGEGGQLPGHKVDDYIAGVRHSTPGVGLISPPPHHDIYSIEDLKQLIFDLRCANPAARISVKLVSEVGVGTVAAGVAKANSDHVVIAGHDGGTGASPVSSIHSAGVPWEIGLAETQQTLVMNRLRDRITVQTDGQLKTGRDVVVAALLGAEEFGFATAPLIAMGCIMMRACHLNTCPVGIATQDPELRRRFQGRPEHVVNYFFFIADEVRELMAQLGVRRFDDLVGRTDLLEADAAIEHWKARGVDVSGILAPPDAAPEVPRRRVRPQDPVLDDHLDHALIGLAGPALERGRAGGARHRGEEPPPHGRRPALGRGGTPPRRRGPRGRHDRGPRSGLGRAELRRLARTRRHAAARGRRQRLCRQGHVRWRALRSAAGRIDLQGRGARDRGQHRALRRHQRARVLPRAGGRALRRAQLGRQRRGRGRRRPRLRVHDRRPRGRARPHRPQLRCRHERWHRLRARPRRPLPRALQPRAGRAGDARRRGLRGDPRAGGGASRPHRQPGGDPRAGRLAGADRLLGQGHADRLQARAGRGGRAAVVAERAWSRREGRGRDRGQRGDSDAGG